MRLFIALLFLSLCKNSLTSKQSTSQHLQQKDKSQQKLSQLKQLLSYLQDPQIYSLLKLNLQTLENQKANVLASWYSKQQIDTIVQIKKSLNSWKQCQKKQPYFDGQNCISCKNKGQVFDVVTKKCAICLSGTIYDKKKKSCVSRSSIMNIALTEMDPDTAEEILLIRLTRTAGSMMSFVHQQTDKLKFRLNVDSDYPYSLNGTPNATNPHFVNLIIFKKNQKLSNYDLDFGDIPCPKQYPFYGNKQCKSCNYPTHLFDSTTKLCVKCSTAYIYSIKQHKCVKNPDH